MRPVLAAMMILSACAAPMADDDLRDHLAGRTLVLDRLTSDDPDWPQLRWTFGSDGTRTGTFRSVMQPHRPRRVQGYWWVDGGRLCRGNDPGPTERKTGSCCNVTLEGDQFESKYAREYMRPTPYFTLPPRSVLVD